MKDEDIAFPPAIVKNHKVEIREVVAEINEHISAL